MEFGTLRGKSKSSNPGSSRVARKTYSASNISCVSTNSAYVGRKSLCLTLPRDFGAEVGLDGRILDIGLGGPAHKTGVLQIGDYIRIIEESEDCDEEETISLQITYSVLQVEQRPNCPLVVEIGNRSRTSLGIALADSAENKIRISSIRPGSLADRCGFLSVGDVLTSVQIRPNETIPCSPYYTSFQIAEILRKLASMNPLVVLTISPHENSSSNGEASSSSTGTLMRNESPFFDVSSGQDGDDHYVLSLCLWKDRLYEDWGFSLVDNEVEDEEEDEEQAIMERQKDRVEAATVHEIRPGGPAFLAGLKTGDRLLQINERDVSCLESTILVPILASLEDALNLVILRSRK